MIVKSETLCNRVFESHLQFPSKGKKSEPSLAVSIVDSRIVVACV